MKEEHGLDVFFGGCPVCKELCCCNNKSVFCHRKNHCYRKCPATKTNGKHATTTVKDDSDSEPPYQEEIHSIPKPENGQYGIFDLLAAVADMDKANPTLCRPAKSAASGVATGAPPRKKPKQGKDGMSAGKTGYPNNMLLGEPSAYAPYFSGSSSLPDAASSLQMLHQKSPSSSSSTSQGMPMGLSGDSGVDGYTFNNNTMGIIPGGINGVDAITLMGQQKQRFPNAMDKLNMSMANDPLLSSINTAAASSSAASATTLSHSAAATAAATSNLGIFGRLPSIDSNPFSISSAKDANRTTPTFDQALLDSVRNIQADPYHMAMGRPLPSVPRSVPTSATATASGFSPGIASAGAGVDHPAVPASAAEPTKLAVDPKAVSAASLEPMNLLALVSSFTQSLDKSTHLLPAEHLFLGTTAASAAAAAAQEASKATKTEDSK